MRSKSLVLSLVILLMAALGATLARAQDQSVKRELAAQGDTIWVILNHVKPDQTKQFERFYGEILWPAAKRLSEAEKRVFRQTRVLYPAGPEADGTFTYIFIMDPVIPGADYEIPNLLRKMYGTDKAEEYLRMFKETAAAPQTMYTVVQSRF